MLFFLMTYNPVRILVQFTEPGNRVILLIPHSLKNSDTISGNAQKACTRTGSKLKRFRCSEVIRSATFAKRSLRSAKSRSGSVNVRQRQKSRFVADAIQSIYFKIIIYICSQYLTTKYTKISSILTCLYRANRHQYDYQSFRCLFNNNKNVTI